MSKQIFDLTQSIERHIEARESAYDKLIELCRNTEEAFRLVMECAEGRDFR